MADLVEEEPRMALCALRAGAPALMGRTPFLPGWTRSVSSREKSWRSYPTVSEVWIW